MPPSPDEISARKARLRLQMRAHRAHLTPAERERASRLVCQNLRDWLRTRAGIRSQNKIAVYLSLPDEISLDTLCRELLNRGYIVCAPRVDRVAGTMQFYRLARWDAISRGAYNVREPLGDEIVRPDLALVPGLAFDRDGHRLGRGGGWYDRALSAIPVKVGVGFRGQRAEEVPVEAHDVKMDWLASDAGLASCP